MKNYAEFLEFSDQPYVIYKDDRIVYHTTGEKVSNDIKRSGFKTGKELDISEKRDAIYFSDLSVNPGMYARNREDEIYHGQEIGTVPINIKGLKLLNMNYKKDGIFVHHKKYNNFVIGGELDKLPKCDGSISFLKDGRIYEVALRKETANKLLITKF